MKVELFYAPGCRECAAATQKLRLMAQEIVPNLVWQELNVLDELDYAVELGVLALPAIAIDGVQVFSSIPTQQQLRRELLRRAGKKL